MGVLEGRQRQRRGAVALVASASGWELDLAYPLLCSAALGSSLARARLLPPPPAADAPDREFWEPSSVSLLQGLPVPSAAVAAEAARGAAVAAISRLPYINFLAWPLAAAGSGTEALCFSCCYGAIYCLPLCQLLASPADSRSLVAAICALLVCPLHLSLQQRLDAEASGQPALADRESPQGSQQLPGTSTASSGRSSRLPSQGALQAAQEAPGSMSSPAGSTAESPIAADGLAVDLLAFEEQSAASQWDRRMALRLMTVRALREMARERGVPGRSKMRKAELVAALEAVEGISDTMDEQENGEEEEEEG